MTRRRIAEPVTKVTMNLFTQDVDRMKALYPGAGYTQAIRLLIRQHLIGLDRRTAAVLDVDIDIDI